MNECAKEANEGDRGCHCHHCGCHADERHDVGERMFYLAKCAKYSLLKQKMEKLLDAKIGGQLDKIAEIAAEAVIDHMQRMGAKKQASQQYEQDLLAALKRR
jgi:hypothetical protein